MNSNVTGLTIHISDNIGKKEIMDFIKRSTHQQKRISLTTDGKPIYKNIADGLGFIHNIYASFML